MNTAENTNATPTSQRPLGFWLKVIDHKVAIAKREVFIEYGIGRRDWRRLATIARGIEGSSFARLAAHPEKVTPLVERGWVQGATGAWTLTDAGQTTYDELLERVSGIRAQITRSVSAEDFATTMASLEAIARGLGYSDSERMPRRGFHGRRGRRGGEGRTPRA